MSKKLPKFMTKGGPGDKDFKMSLLDGKVDTSSWFVRPLQEFDDDGRKRHRYRPNMLDKGTIAQQAKDQEIFFCDIPFTQLYMEIDGNYQTCCFAHPPKTHNVLNTTMKEWMEDAPAMNTIRAEMLDPDSEFKNVKRFCERCVNDEKRYGRSRRTACMKIHSNEPDYWEKVDRSAKLFNASGMWAFDERIIEIQLKMFGSECNLDCYMCVHANSTIRQKVAIEGGVWNDAIFEELDEMQLEKLHWVSRDKTEILKEKDVKQDNAGGFTIPKFKVEEKIRNTVSMIDQTLELAPYTRSIKIIGGEPLIMKKHYELLDKLIEMDEAKNIIIKYQTNLTEMKAGKHNIFNYIPHFKLVSMVASVDGIGETIEYMRRRCSWDKIVKNAEICNTYDNVDVDFNGLVSFLSVMRFYEVIDWCLENPIIDQINWAMLETPPLLRVNNLPQKIKDDLIPKYEQWPDIQSALEMPAERGLDIQEVFDYMLDADEYYKGTKWEKHLFDVFPELEEYYIPKENRLLMSERNLSQNRLTGWLPGDSKNYPTNYVTE